MLTELTRGQETRPLYLSKALARHDVCVPLPPTNSAGQCVQRAEWFLPGTSPEPRPASGSSRLVQAIHMSQPTSGLQIAFDPRLPAESQMFEFLVKGAAPTDRVLWIIDGRSFSRDDPAYRWPVERGEHRVAAFVWRHGALVAELPEVAFNVK